MQSGNSGFSSMPSQERRFCPSDSRHVSPPLRIVLRRPRARNTVVHTHAQNENRVSCMRPGPGSGRERHDVVSDAE